MEETNNSQMRYLDTPMGVEILSKRGRKEKHFLQKDGSIIAQTYSDNVHFKKDGKYEEINNTLLKDGEYYKNKSNEFTVFFKNNSLGKLLKYQFNNNYIEIELLNCNNSPITIIENNSKYTKMVKYDDVYDGIDLEYIVTSSKVKENIIINNKGCFPKKIGFKLNSSLHLEINNNNKINAIKEGKKIFTFDLPYMLDSNGIINENIYYDLTKTGIDEYHLYLVLDEKWANSEHITYPIIIDPTISTNNTGTVNDTYISSKDINKNYSKDEKLIVGVQRNNNVDVINRTLVKCNLPQIGTGSQVYSATLFLFSYPVVSNDGINKRAHFDVHRITKEWSESSATWSNMNDSYDIKIEDSGERLSSLMYADKEIYDLVQSQFDITSVVQKWYSGTPNYGVMIKAHKEVLDTTYTPMFFSQDADVNGFDPKPSMLVRYRNQSGIEDYMDFQKQDFTGGTTYENTFNGNVIATFDLGNTINGDYPAELELVYNTNDVVLDNNIGFGLGFKLNVWQTIKKIPIYNEDYLELYDENGTLHYFQLDGEIYKDEDDLNMTIKEEPTKYVLTDPDGNVMSFNKINNIGYLTESIDNDGNKINIYYNSENKINKIVDSLGYSIELTYGTDKISIVSPAGNVSLNYTNGLLSSISGNNGSTLLSYNNKNLISKITDVNGMSVGYEYYEESPYRVHKVSEYGVNGEEGTSFSISYGYKCTTIEDNKNRVTTIMYNERGNAISVNDLKEKDSIIDAHGSVYGYYDIDGVRNRLFSSKLPIKYVKNYLKNISFEDSEMFFTGTENALLSFSNDYARSGKRSLKVSSSLTEEYIKQSISVPRGEYYTFSAYIKNSNKIKLSLCYRDNQNVLIENIGEEIIANEEFSRHDITIYYPNDATSDLEIKIYLVDSGTVYLDDIQLEKGQVANYFNYIENSDFSSELNSWDCQSEDNNSERFEVITLEEGLNALKIKMDPEYGTLIKKVLNISGKKGDTYNLSFWYKNNGLLTANNNSATIGFNNLDEEDFGHCIEPIPLNPNDNSWQYFSVSYTAEHTYDTVYINLFQDHDANDLLITNISLFKGVITKHNGYNEEGILNETVGLMGEKVSLDYDNNNQLANITHFDGEKTFFEYDNKHKDRLLSKINRNGLTEKYNYDSHGNIILKRLIKYNYHKGLENGLYQIRAKGTERYIGVCDNMPSLKKDSCGHDKWLLEKEGEYFKIRHSINENEYLSVFNNSLVMTKFSEQLSLFTLIKNNNGSYTIQLKDTTRYLKHTNGNLEVVYLESDNNSSFEFYFEQKDDEIFIESSAEYTEDGRFPINSVDTNFHKTAYDINTNNGLLKSETDAKGNTRYYAYNQSQQITSRTDGNRNIRYTYNNNGLLEKILQGTKKYTFVYDEFLNAKQVKVGDNTILITNNYENNNGNLKSIKYGNNNEISYEYDNFDRIIKETTMDNTYQLKYGNNGDLLKVISNDGIERYEYDYGQRLNEYKNNEFRINYNYNINNDIEKTTYHLNDINTSIENEFDLQGAITKSSFEGNKINYNFDSLGRMSNIIINDNFQTDYSYITKGKRTSTMIKSLNNNGDKYSYIYDELNNITHIYHNGNLENQYYHNRYSELIGEDNYLLNKTIRYKYDQHGNILSKKFYNLKTFDLIDEIAYKYENSDWCDQLTSYNDNLITYDEIGNITTFGNNCNFSWINGRSLNSYSSEGLNISYKYNKDGIRIKKTINGIETKYYLDKDDVIFEKTGDNVIYYIRNDIDDLVGFKYNHQFYYYIKNHSGDILGILDSNNNIVAKYVYDSWGSMISITDGDGIDVTNIPNHIANINPFRYRGYYYDKETKLYYLNTRYYNPQWGRFINADGMVSEEDGTDTNMYAYVVNNPVNNVDPDGKHPLLIFAVKAIGAVLTAAGAYSAYKKWKKKKSVKTTIELAVSILPGAGYVSKAAKLGKAASGVKAFSSAKGKASTTKKAVSRVTNTPKNSSKWSPGESINKMTYKGNPTWATVRSRFWKNEAYYNKSAYSADDIARMVKGKPPLRWDKSHNKWMPMEIHHKNGRKGANPHDLDNLKALTALDHAKEDPFRARTYGKMLE